MRLVPSHEWKQAMSRSRHHGCKAGGCGMCMPHKRFKSNSLHQQTPAVRRVFEGHKLDLRDDPPRVAKPDEE
jgi:hypothetical protein